LTFVTDIDSHNGQLFIVGSAGSLSYYGTSVDDGSSWNLLDISDATEVMGTPICVGFFNDLEGTIGIKGSFTKDYLITNDGGDTWASTQLLVDTSCTNILQPYDFYRVNDSVGLYNGFLSGQYMITRNAGQSWSCSTQFSTSWTPQFHILNDSVWYTKDNNGLYLSEDSGESWEKVLDKEITHFQVNDQDIIALSTYYSEPNSTPVLYRTENDWLTYDSIPLSDFNGKNVTLFVKTDSAEMYLIESENIYYSKNGTSDFQLVQILEQAPFKTSYVNGDWFLSGRGLARLNGPLVSSTQQPALNNVRVFPNPAWDKINIEFQEQQGRCTFQLYDITGRQLIETQIDRDQTLDISNLTGGIYFYTVKNHDAILLSDKLTVVK